MLGEFLLWWGQQLQALWPSRGGAAAADAVLATLRPGDTVDVAIRRRGQATPLGGFPLTAAGMAALRGRLGASRLPSELHLTPGLVLEQAVVLPLAAERDPAQVLRYEMDRLTPFSAEELVWSWAPLRRDRARAQLHLRLSLVPRAAVAPILDALRIAGLHPACLAGEAGRRVSLQPRRAGRWQRSATLGLAAACAALAIAAVALPFEAQRAQSRRLERSIAALRPVVDRAEALRRGLVSSAAGVDVLAAERARVGDPLQVLAALTTVLPDDTVLSDVALRQRVVTISGQSAAAARLIPALAAEPSLRDPAFIAPVTRNETMHAEGFSIRALAIP